ncbi:type I glutamate--ammonia ligase [Candidatus Peribacteria bacterium]|jgi:glutamine synthetase|nr:type I glutamate--ammonia ligase [Candidatus Peribacteria bacterium]MBT4021065.1 type I glutamate--ammonia ligase [Candidatus Peribacteria bacterium]MBT4240786.1 type I glutamate--ammonia ligase [Candidatus Peribacteria bacterium]MBT4474185.1 type I glutamate--ammonia ligase [Candidatus Peribacteria bacterium]
MQPKSKEQILETVRRENVQFIRLQFTDICGNLKAVTIPVSKLEDAINHNVWFDGSSVEGFTRICESDMFLKLDLNTFAIIPWTKENGIVVARFICDVFMPDGQPFAGDPRYILKKQMERAAKMGHKYFVGPELEFFLFEKGDNGELLPIPHDSAGYFDQTTDKATSIRKEIALALDDFGLDVEALHHEVAPAQHEIAFKYADALATADAATTMKLTIKSIADKHNLYGTFMPKPIEGINGSGMHVHQSLFDGEAPIFYDPNDAYKLSQTAKWFMAGQLKHIKAICAITNPLVNSYKRLVAGYEAPVFIAWGQKNRSTLIRVPRYAPGREKATRFELRCPDPSANPYLAFAVMLAAGLDGIEKRMYTPDPVEENLYELSVDEAKKKGFDVLPQSLDEALKQLESDMVIRDALGPHTYESFMRAKKAECEGYRVQVSDWEIDTYFEKY